MTTLFSTTHEAIRGSSGELSNYLHPDYIDAKIDWDMIRDCIAGERKIKDRGRQYLPGLDVETGTTYEQYKERASFVNMVGRTVQGLVGTVFRRPVKVDNVDKDNLKDVTADGLDFNLFCKKVAIEVCALGRVGVLVEMSEEGGKPYMCEYIAENILSWKTKKIRGREQPVYVLLREIADLTPSLTDKGAAILDSYFGVLTARYRVLWLDESDTYRQALYREVETTDEYGNPKTVLMQEGPVITPTNGGATFDFIPMKIIGPLSPTWNVQKSPVLDIATLNIAHYRTSAQLEHGRFFTALPVYYIPISGSNDKNSYDIGPSVVWEVPEGQKPGILEYFGTGLKNLADSLVEKEEHIAQLGGRIMGIRPQASGESEQIYKMKQANEMSILLNITESVSAAMTDVLSWWLDWQRIPSSGYEFETVFDQDSDDTEGRQVRVRWSVRVRLNQDFKALQIAARELRAVALLYQSGILPVDQVFRALQEAEWIDDEMTLEEFENSLKNLESFPMQPDVEAMHDGFPDAKTKIQVEQTERQMRMQERQSDMDREHQLLMEERKHEQQSSLQDEMFTQGVRTQQMEHQQQMRLEKQKAANQAKVAKAAAKARPAAAKKPAAKKKPK